MTRSPQNRYLVAGRWYIYAADEEHALERYYVEVVHSAFDWSRDDPDETIEYAGRWQDGRLICAPGHEGQLLVGVGDRLVPPQTPKAPEAG